MTDFLLYNLHVAALMAVFYMFWRLLLSRETLHRLNRVVLLSVVVLSAVLPLCVVTLHKTVVITAPPATEPAAATATTVAMGESASGWEPWLWLAATVYVAGAVLTLAHSVISVVKLKRLISRCERHRQADGTVVAVSDDEQVQPFSWMGYIVMNRSDYEERNAPIMAHERAHISARHSWDVLLVDALTPLQWFNPAVWMLRADLRALHEFEADQAVLSQGYDARQYQYLLVRKAVATHGYSVANRLSHSTLKQRINMMTQKKSGRASWLKALYIVPVTAVSLALSARTVTNYQWAPTPDRDKTEASLLQDKNKAAGKTNTPQANKQGDIIKAADDEGIKMAHPDMVRIGQEADGGKPLVIINGTEMPYEQFIELNANIIKSIEVLKNSEGISKYGEKAKDGVMLVQIEDHPNQQGHEPFRMMGTVLDENRKPVIGAAIMVKGTKKGTVSDMDGNFSIDVPDGATLEVAYIGMATATVKADRKTMAQQDGRQSRTAILLKADAPEAGTKNKLALEGNIKVKIDGEEVPASRLESTNSADIESISIDKNDPANPVINVKLKAKH